MRNWNYIGILKVTNKRRVFILPMRNWNDYYSAQIKTEKEFSSYLWGIETSPYPANRLSTHAGFHLTYEELKLFCGQFLGYLFDRRFHLTYEELKQAGLPFKFEIYLSFHLTYEELKQESVKIYVPSTIGVFILPMRNWNNMKKIVNLTPHAVGFHLTYEELKRVHIQFWCVSHICFHLTYEELKHNRPFFHSSNVICFHLTYEELKHTR